MKSAPRFRGHQWDCRGAGKQLGCARLAGDLAVDRVAEVPQFLDVDRDFAAAGLELHGRHGVGIRSGLRGAEAGVLREGVGVADPGLAGGGV